MCVPTISLREAKHGFLVDIFEKKVTIPSLPKVRSVPV